MHGLIEGRNVHYVDREGVHHAAIIVAVTDAVKATVNVFVPPKSNVAGSCRIEEDVRFAKSESSAPHTVHWIERVE